MILREKNVDSLALAHVAHILLDIHDEKTSGKKYGCGSLYCQQFEAALYPLGSSEAQSEAGPMDWSLPMFSLTPRTDSFLTSNFFSFLVTVG